GHVAGQCSRPSRVTTNIGGGDTDVEAAASGAPCRCGTHVGGERLHARGPSKFGVRAAARRMTFPLRSLNVWARTMRTTSSFASTALTLALIAISGAAWAAPPAPREREPPEKQEYRALIDDAVAEYDAHHFEEARALF